MASQINILVVDDEESIRFLFDRFLRKIGYEVYTAADLSEVKALIAETDFHTALIDRILSEGQNGLDLVQHLKTVQPFCRTILMTAYPSYESAAEALRYGIHAYLTKPVTREQICRVVNESVDESIAERESRRRQDLFQPLFDASPDASVVCDQAGRITAANQAFVTRFGYHPPELIGRPLPIVPSGDWDAFLTELTLAFKNGSTPERKTDRITRSGESIAVCQRMLTGRGGGPSAEALVIFRNLEKASTPQAHSTKYGHVSRAAEENTHTQQLMFKGEWS